MADGGIGARAGYTALQRHVAYFDGDDDGLVGWRETYRGIRALGTGVGWSAVLAAIIVLALGKLTGGGFTTVRIANIHRGKHPSDTGIFDSAGELVLPRFQALFASVAQSSAPDRISFVEFRAFMKLGPQSAVGDFFSWAEAKLFFCVATDCTKREGAGDVPAIRKRTLLRFYRGELLPRIARLRKLRAERAARRDDAGRGRSHSKISTIEELLMPIDSAKGAVVLITGAAEGIGRATALAFAARGARLWLVDIDEPGLERTAGEARGAGAGTTTRRVDVSDAPAMDALAADVHAEHGALDVLVNNAGVGLAGGFLDTELADWKWILDVNLWGVIHGCRAFVPRMKERGRGQVVNVASAAAFHNLAAMSAYGTSKYAVLGLSEALREELAPHGVGVSAICPGLVRTRIVETMRTRGPRFDDDAARKRVVDLYARRDYAPARVAEVILDAVRRNRAVVPVTAEAWAIHIAKRVAPGATRRVLRWTNRLVDR